MKCRFCATETYLNMHLSFLDVESLFRYSSPISYLKKEELPSFYDICDDCLKTKLFHEKIAPFLENLAYKTRDAREFNKYDFPTIVTSLMRGDIYSDQIHIGTGTYIITKNNALKLINNLLLKVSKGVNRAFEDIRKALIDNDIELLISSLEKEVIVSSAKKRGRFTQKEMSELCNVSVGHVVKYMKRHDYSYLYNDCHPVLDHRITGIRRSVFESTRY